MKCPVCGTELERKQGLDTCPICGSPIEWVEEPVKKKEKNKIKKSENKDITEKKSSDEKKDVYDDIHPVSYESKKNKKSGSVKTILFAAIAVLLLIVVIEGGILIKNASSPKMGIAAKESTESASAEAENDDTDSLVINNRTDDAADENADADADTDADEDESSEDSDDTEVITAEVTEADYDLLDSCDEAKITDSWASSVVQDNVAGVNNEPEMMVDGDEITSWQEGASGDGTGETVEFTLNKKCDIKYIAFKMGNWRDQERYDENYRPKSIRLEVGDQEFDLNFPNGKNEYMVTFSEPVSAENITVEITSTYKGTKYREWQDCCISEMTVYKV